MKFERVAALSSLILSTAAVLIALYAAKRDPLGTDLSKYDLSSPEKTLRSVNAMVAKRDLKASMQMLQSTMLRDSTPWTKLFFSEAPDIEVIKSIEVSDSAGPKNVGLIVSFVKFRLAGVDYYIVKYFRKDESNRFQLGETFYVPFGTEPNEQDKALQKSIEQFEKTGKI